MELRASARLICIALFVPMSYSIAGQLRTPNEVGIVFWVILRNECKALLVFIYFCLEGLGMGLPKNSQSHFEIRQTNAGDLSGRLMLEMYQAD